MWNELKLLILTVFLIAIAAGLFEGFKRLTPVPVSPQAVIPLNPASPEPSPTDVSPTPTPTPTPSTPPGPTPVGSGTGTSVDSGVIGTAMIGPTCPVMRMPPEPGCDDKPYKGQFIISSSDPTRNFGYLVASDANGKFSYKLPPGSYNIRLSGGATMPSMQPQDFVVKAHAYTALSLELDSGIR